MNQTRRQAPVSMWTSSLERMCCKEVGARKERDGEDACWVLSKTAGTRHFRVFPFLAAAPHTAVNKPTDDNFPPHARTT